MSILYKFRSSVNFEAVDIGNRAAISIGELRSRIMRSVFQKRQGFDDLLFYDAVSGLEFESDDSEIPSGSSVIVKRVPGETVPSAVLPDQAVNHAAIKESPNPNPTVNNAAIKESPNPNPVVNHAAIKESPNPNPASGPIDQTNCKGNNKNEVAGLRLPIPKIWAVQTELECSLCCNFLKEAVMVPCCQHSFCEKCIQQLLGGKGVCPRCSKKCSASDLIPNVSLRRAIAHFLNSQMFGADLGNMQIDVPDRESGNQANNVSRILLRELELPQSSRATGIGSNQVSTEPHYEHEAGSSIKRGGGFWIGSTGGGRNFLGLGGHKKGVRNCYTCGSLYHLMRDCPNTHPNPMFQPVNGVFNGGLTGYASSYWNGPSVPPPYANFYSYAAMMPFNASLVPISPFAVPPCIHSMHGSLPGPGMYMGMNYMGLPCPEHSALQQRGHKKKRSE